MTNRSFDKLMLTLMVSMVALASLSWLVGCNMPVHRPSTEINAPGVKFKDTKDNDISAARIAFDGSSKSGEIVDLVIRNNASDPMRAFTEQQAMYLEGMKEQTKQTEALVNGLGSVVGSVAPLIKDIAAPALGLTDVGGLGLGSLLALGTSLLGAGKKPQA